MKFAAATTLLFATLALASPAPIAQPEALAQPIEVKTNTNMAPEIDARTLEARKKPKIPKTSDGNSTSSAIVSMTPSRAVQLGALGLGVVEAVRLWT
ncbi:hypothetical protein P153DRAFT_371045 [Dothidotthia symphoricarpi CBS 119687]|uniref:Uncharacterized protein n=1 Tax=Dothidotthia symphoricarpi CBS 119687 TaxID=1392245 RepID=A0A6A6A0E8_9PLEO|nr:uncharacterized protein P153DRAFT_371045 [Dothidotthia symphoricarpi CBS 119687]KAF2124168.1 hypothetical protein P153DRAFT_371045 [Dothidotthia symphoricarpi CBS 119687]